MAHRTQKITLGIVVLVALLMAALACTCGPVTTVLNTRATAGALATDVGQGLPTLQAAATEAAQVLPTLQAGATQYGPAIEATLTAVVATADALRGDLPDVPDVSPGFVFDGGDGLETSYITPIDPGQSAPGVIENNFYAHNWLLIGVTGQSVTVRVDGAGEVDPYLKVIDPAGNVIAEDDDSGGGLSPLISLALPSSGVFTLRVTVLSPGSYTISVQ